MADDASLAGGPKERLAQFLDRAVTRGGFIVVVLLVLGAMLSGAVEHLHLDRDGNWIVPGLPKLLTLSGEVILHALRAFLEATAGIFLTYLLIERRRKLFTQWVEQTDQNNAKTNALALLYSRPIPSSTFFAFQRDIVERRLHITDCFCSITLAPSRPASIDNRFRYIVTTEIKETISVLSSFRELEQHTEAHTGDTWPWRLVNFECSLPDDSKTIRYVSGQHPINCKAENGLVKYQLSLSKGDRFARIKRREKSFVGYLLSNHVFIDGAENLTFKVSVLFDLDQVPGDDHEIPPCPIAIFTPPTGEVILMNGKFMPGRTGYDYEYSLSDALLPGQGFSFYFTQDAPALKR